MPDIQSQASSSNSEAVDDSIDQFRGETDAKRPRIHHLDSNSCVCFKIHDDSDSEHGAADPNSEELAFFPPPCCTQLPRVSRIQQNHSDTYMHALDTQAREAKRFCRHGKFYFTHGPDHIRKLTKKRWKSTCFEVSSDIRTGDFNTDVETHPDVLRCFSTDPERKTEVNIRNLSATEQNSPMRPTRSSLTHGLNTVCTHLRTAVVSHGTES